MQLNLCEGKPGQVIRLKTALGVIFAAIDILQGLFKR